MERRKSGRDIIFEVDCKRIRLDVADLGKELRSYSK